MATPTSNGPTSAITQSTYPGPSNVPCDASAVTPLNNYTSLLGDEPIQICQVSWRPAVIDIAPCCTGPVSVQDNCTQYCPAGPEREGQNNLTQSEFNECVNNALREAGVSDFDVRRTSGYCFIAPAVNQSGSGDSNPSAPTTQAPSESPTLNAAPHAISAPTTYLGLWAFAITAGGLALGASLIL